ncbi:DeoR/GlpR family DNA-binding transcription regulator [Aerococcaceae bacterium NML190938]|nr:DeoR/GlpR family DNA-binding transcription regulator [Aerococcaceae bacterium NML190938]
MLKAERRDKILALLEQEGFITVEELVEICNVTKMTIQRDLNELAKQQLINRVHGGAKALNMNRINKHEKSNLEKLSEQIIEKEEIAEIAYHQIENGETVFIGPGTTLECFARKIVSKKLRVITNSLPVFNILKASPTIDLILIGGEFREITGAFVGNLALNSISSLQFSKAFISANAISDNNIATYSDTEGIIQAMALDKSLKKYLLVDHLKFEKFDFFTFYQTKDFDYLITDSKLSKTLYNKYSQYVNILKG